MKEFVLAVDEFFTLRVYAGDKTRGLVLFRQREYGSGRNHDQIEVQCGFSSRLGDEF